MGSYIQMELGVVIPTASRMNKEAMKQRLRAAIAATHGSWLSAFVARTAQAYLNAYNNLCIWDVELNGELAAFKRIVRQTDGVVIDAGANIGQWANATKPYLGGKHLHCFEPIPDVFAKLCANVPEPHITKNNLGLGSELKTIELNYSPTLSSISSSFPLIHPRKDDRPVQCRITTGDAYLTEKGIERVSFLKIDVEGMEMDVLSGFAKALGEGRIGAVQFEHGPSHIHSGHSLKSFVDFFRPFDLPRVISSSCD